MGSAYRFAARSALVLLLASAAACASGGASPEAAPAAPGEITLQIRNTHESGQALQVYIAREAGQERLLGTVGPDDVLSVPHTEGQGRFLFRAVRPDGTSINSPIFNVVSGTYTWDIALQRVQRGR